MRQLRPAEVPAQRRASTVPTMSEQDPIVSGRTFLAGRIISNHGQSSIDCVVRRISDDGASLEVANSDRHSPEFSPSNSRRRNDQRPCKLVWQSDNQLGLSPSTTTDGRPKATMRYLSRRSGRGSDASIGCCATRCWRCAPPSTSSKPASCCWTLSLGRPSSIAHSGGCGALADEEADNSPAFVALMYHGRDTRAYAIVASKLDAYIADRCAWWRGAIPADRPAAGDGEVIRIQCTALATAVAC